MNLGSALLSAALLYLAADSAAEDAKRHFEKGVRLLDAEEHQAAADQFERSLRIQETLPALYNLALAYRALGRHREAKDQLELFLDRSGDPEVKQRARSLLTDIEKNLAQVTILVRGEVHAVAIDGRELRGSGGEYRVTLEPGAHLLALSRSGFKPENRSLRTEAGQAVELELEAPHTPLSGTIVVHAQPVETQIAVDGVWVGSGSYTGTHPIGSHTITAAAPEHLPASQKIELAADATQEITLALEAESSSIISEWWFWAGIGAVVAAGVATAVVLGNQTDPYCGSVDQCFELTSP